MRTRVLTGRAACDTGIFVTIVAAALLVCLAWATPAHAFPRLPANFWGGVIDAQTGTPAPAGLPVAAVVDAMPVSQTTTFSSAGATFYRLDVVGDDPDTAQKEGPREGESFKIIVDSRWTVNAVWHGGSDSRLDLKWIMPASLNDGPAAPAAPAPAGAAAGGAAPAPPTAPSSMDLKINIIGTAGAFAIDSLGRLKDKATVTVAGGGITLSLLPGTKLTAGDGITPMTGITVQPLSTPPLLPARMRIIGQALNIGPPGLKLDRPAALVLTYSPSQLPPGAAENKLSGMTWNGKAWETVKSSIDTGARTVTLEINGAGIYALAAWIPETAPVAPPLPSFPPGHDGARHSQEPPKPAPTSETIVIPTPTKPPQRASVVQPPATPAPEKKPDPSLEDRPEPASAPAVPVSPSADPARTNWWLISAIIGALAAGLVAWRVFFHVPRTE